MVLRKQKTWLWVILGTLGLALLAAFWSAQQANAQCGSQASSCKTCHETESKMPVNNDGTGWHQSHSFGDFCYICHAGNNQSMVVEEAHTGLVAPLSDPKAACMSCHPADLDARVQVYAAALASGGGAAAGGGSPAAPATTEAPAQPAPAATEAPAEPAPAAAPAVPPAEPPAVEALPPVPVVPGAPAAPVQPAKMVEIANPPPTLSGVGEVVNYNQRYDSVTTVTNPVNWGMIIFLVGIVLLIVIVILLAARSGRRPAKPAAAPVPEGATPEAAALLPQISQLSPAGVAALQRMLQSPEQANELLRSLSSLDPELIQRVRSLDPETRSLLMSLANDQG